MTKASTGGNEARAGLAEALDWQAARTWRVFGAFAMGLGATSGLIIIATELLGEMIIAPAVTVFNPVAQAFSIALHCTVLFLLSKLVPLRSPDGAILREQKILSNPAENVLVGFRPFLAWAGTISLVTVLIILGQPLFELPGSVGSQSWLPIIFAFYGARFPASVILARSREREARTESTQ